MPSVPGEPPQTKYPILYPWVLSWVWAWSAEFPDNLVGAFWVNAFFGCLFLAGAFVLLRQLGAGRIAALVLTALCALHPQMLNLSALLLSDVPFMAWGVWLAVAAGAALRRPSEDRESAWPLWIVAGVLGTLAVATRSIGISLVAGVAVAAFLRHRPKPAMAVLGLGLAAFAPAVVGLVRPTGVVAGSPAAPGYEQTMLFYTSYGGFWRLSVPDLATLTDQLGFNLLELLKTPATLCYLVPAAGFADGIWQAIAVALSVAILRGAFPGARPAAWHPIHFLFLFYVPVVLLWNYTLMERFLLLFLPLLLWGALQEGGKVFGAVRNVFRKPSPNADRAAAALMAGLFAVLLTYTVYRGAWELPSGMAQAREQREALAAEKARAYEWVRNHTAPSERFVAYEDASLFLHTGRQALRPVAISTASFFRQQRVILDQELTHLADTAQTIEARYWLVSPDDYHLESADAFLQKATKGLLEGCPVSFATSPEGIRIYEVSSLQERGCGSPKVARRAAMGGRDSATAVRGSDRGRANFGRNEGVRRQLYVFSTEVVVLESYAR